MAAGSVAPVLAQVRIGPADKGEISIQKELFLLKDPDHRLGIQDLRTHTFKANIDNKNGYGYSDAAYWIRFTLIKHPDNNRQWFLKHGYPHLDRLDFYSPSQDGGYTRTRAGDTQPFDDRGVDNRFFLFPIDPGQTGTTYYLRISSSGVLNFPLSVIDRETVLKQDQNRQVTEGLFFGALLIMAAYHLLFFLFVRERPYLYYFFHLLFLLIHQLTLSGFGFEYLWQNHTWLNNFIDIFSSLALLFFLGLFTMEFIQTKQNMPRIHWMVTANTLLLGLMGILICFIPRDYLLVPTNLANSLQLLLIMVAAAVGCTKGLRQAHVFMTAWLLALSGGLLLGLSKTGLIPELPVYSFGIQIGCILNILFISLGLTDRVTNMKNALVLINQEAERQNRELTKACKNLEASEKRFRSLSEMLPQTVFETDFKGRITYTNRQGEALTGYTTQELTRGISVYDLSDIQEHHKIRHRMKKILVRPAISQSEFILKRKDGSRVPVFAYNSVIFNGKKPKGFRGVVLDMTERKKTEALMIQTEKMMSMGGLAAGMAHEINNPLTGMIQSAQVIRNRLTVRMPANERAVEDLGTSMDIINGYMEKRGILTHLDTIDKAGKRAAKLVENMLGFARKSDSVKTFGSLSDIIDKALDLASNDFDLEKNYAFKDIDIIKAYSPDLPEIPCEASKIQQVVFNLLKNASQAIQAWEEMPWAPRIKINLSSADQKATIEISDNGPGMDEATRAKIFEPFFTTKEIGKGTGLGLSVSYFIIVDDHGGEMEVLSSPGQGTTFIIRLPEGRP